MLHSLKAPTKKIHITAPNLKYHPLGSMNGLTMLASILIAPGQRPITGAKVLI